MIQVQLKQLLRRRRMSQRELARMIGRHHDVISRFARQDTSGVSYELLSEICAVLDCQPGDFIRYDPEPEVQIPLFRDEGESEASSSRERMNAYPDTGSPR